MKTKMRRVLTGFCAGLTLLAFTSLIAVAQQQMPKTTKESVKGAATETKETLSGTVVTVDGNQLLVRMSTGDLRTFNVPESRKFIIDGKELSVHDLKPGTKLTATLTTTTTPVTERTTTIGTGKVWYVAGNTVIVTLPNNENRMYKVNDNYKFMVDGKETGVHGLRKGMTIHAEKIVEEPRTEIAYDTTVTGSAPPPPAPKKTEVAQATTPPPAPAPAPARRAEPEASRAQATPPPPAPVAAAPAEPPATLPKTGSPVPLFGALGALFTAASFGLRRLRRY